MKKRVIITIALILLFLVGLSILLYPIVADYVNSQSQSRVIARYSEELSHLNETDYSDILESARAYNRRLINKQNRFVLNDEELEEYHAALDFTGKGVIGTLEIEEIKVKLPVYLGTSESILQVGIGHLEGSSLPIGGSGTHSVVSGHRGLPSSTLLNNVDKLEIGDTFVLKILNETLTYQIDHIVIVDPDNYEYLEIDSEKDYCTVFTCTPYGINTQRLLLRGCRIYPEEPEKNDEEQMINTNQTLRSDANKTPPVVGYVLITVPILILSLMYMFVRYRKTK